MSVRSLTSTFNSGGTTFVAHDPAPQVRPAGYGVAPDIGGVRAAVMQSSLQEQRAETPDHVKPFRRGRAVLVGTTVRHPGLRNDEPHDPNLGYGRKNVKDGSVEECLNPGAHADRMNTLASEKAEQRYLSNRKEPLGRVPDPSVPLPKQLLLDGFGIPTFKSESAKSVIYSCGDKEGKMLHPAGEQKTRNYNWPADKADPSYRFGATSNANPVTTKQLLQPQEGAQVLPKIVQDTAAVGMPGLGKTKNFGFGGTRTSQGSGMCYGKTMPRDQLDARSLISGAAVEELGGYADSDPSGYNGLGSTFVKSATQRKLRANDKAATFAQFGDTNRALGVPSIRNDIPKPDESKRKVTNGVNYGDDVNAKLLLYPCHYIREGVLGKYYNGAKTLEEIKELFVGKLKFDLTETQIETAFFKVAVNGVAAAEDVKNALDDLGY